MRILVTAGNTQVPIDRVRCITNIFTGRTGTRIALHAHDEGHEVTLLTSHPDVVDALRGSMTPVTRWTLRPFRTFDELAGHMETAVRGGGLDAVIHCAAVSDFLFDGAFAPAPGTTFDSTSGEWVSTEKQPTLLDRGAAKIRSDDPELWLRLVRAPKIIDRIRGEWGYRGVLVKFKLEVDIDETHLRTVAERARQESDADLMVANTLDGADSWALIGPVNGRYDRIERASLSSRLLSEVERMYAERTNG